MKSTVYKILRKTTIKVTRKRPTLVGKVYDQLYVDALIRTGLLPNGKKYDVYSCICSCGNIVEKRCRGLKSGASICCVQCSHKKIDRIGPRLGKIPSIIKLRMLSGAISRNIYVDNSIDDDFLWDLYLLQNKLCSISGVKIGFGEHSKDTNGRTASIDRIDSTKGYTKDNIQWVHKKVNEMKWNSVQEEFINWCKIIAKNN